MNVLITSSGSKVLLVKNFLEAAKQFGLKVFTADIINEVASSFFSDRHFILPRTSDKIEFVSTLKNICINNNIGLIVPTRDGELNILSEIKDDFSSIGILILVPEKETVDICLNKRKFSNFVSNLGFSSIPVIKNLNSINPPYFIRPVYGASSVGTRTANSIVEAEMFNNEDFLIHPFIYDKEYSIDLLMNLEGTRALQAVCRERSQIIGGESKISKVVDLPILMNTCMEIGEKLKLVGHNVLQAFYTDDLGVTMIEANARFGGASNLSIASGLNSPIRILKMLKNDFSAYENIQIKMGLNMYRYSEDIIIEEKL